MSTTANELTEKQVRRIEEYLRILDKVNDPNPRFRSQRRAYLHLKIAKIYDDACLPWAIAHYRQAILCWEDIRKMVEVASDRLQMLDRFSGTYYRLFSALMREAALPATERPTAFPAADAVLQIEFAGDIPRLRRGDALAYAYQALQAARARTFGDRLHAYHFGGEMEPPSLEKMARILAERGHVRAALITLYCDSDASHAFCFTGSSYPTHFPIPITRSHIDDIVEQIWRDHHSRLFNVTRPRTELTPHWQLLQTLGDLIAPAVEGLEPGTPLLLEPHMEMAQLPLALLRVGEQFLIERHPLAIVSSSAHLMLARKRNHNRRLNGRADPTDKILAVGVGRSESERTRVDFNPLGDWGDLNDASPELRAEPLLWENATVANIKDHLRDQRFCAFTCHGHYEHRNVEDSGLLLFEGEKLDLDALAEMKINVDLVFCNSCVSAQSRSQYGEEPFGVPMSMALAGVPCVVGSLWNVWYPAGCHTLREFFRSRRKCGRQIPAAVALQQAILSTRKVFPDPFHWGGWLLYGDWI